MKYLLSIISIALAFLIPIKADSLINIRTNPVVHAPVKKLPVPAPKAAQLAKVVETPKAPTPAPKPAVAARSGSCEAEIAKYDWNQIVALNVSRAESSLNPNARGDAALTYYQNGVRYGDSWGCFQIRYLPSRKPPSELVNAQINVKTAYDMWRSQGWSPWTVCRTTVNCY